VKIVRKQFIKITIRLVTNKWRNIIIPKRIKFRRHSHYRQIIGFAMSLPICQNKLMAYIHHHHNSSCASALIVAKREAHILLQNYYHSTPKYLYRSCQTRPYSAIYYSNPFFLPLIIFSKEIFRLSSIWLVFMRCLSIKCQIFDSSIYHCFEPNIVMFWSRTSRIQVILNVFQPYSYYPINNYSNITQMLHTLF
jgi:hypothetical protein